MGDNVEYDNFAVIAQPNSEPVDALNGFYELTSSANLSDWSGTATAKQRLYNPLPEASSTTNSFGEYIFRGTSGIHLEPTNNDCVTILAVLAICTQLF